MKVGDYTRVPIGTKLEGSVIERCPHCGSNGLPVTVDGKTRYNHGIVISSEQNQEFDMGFSWCPKG